MPRPDGLLRERYASRGDSVDRSGRCPSDRLAGQLLSIVGTCLLECDRLETRPLEKRVEDAGVLE